MAGTMSSADLVADLKASLHDAATVFTAANDADFVRHLGAAAADFGSVRPRVLSGSITLTAGKAEYYAPSGMTLLVADRWGDGVEVPPWEANYPGAKPRVILSFWSGVRSMIFRPPPSSLQIALWGSLFEFEYLAPHAIGAAAADTTIEAGDRALLIMRAQAEALREMAMRNVNKPVQLRDGYSGTPRNGTPAALFQVLLDEFKAAVR